MRLDEPQVPVDAARNPGEDVGGPCRRVRNTPLLTGGVQLIVGLAPRGRLIFVGASPEQIQVDPVQLIFGARSLEGSLTGTAIEIEDTLAFSVLENVRAMIETIPLERTAEAYARLMRNEARFRIVLTTDQPDGRAAVEDNIFYLQRHVGASQLKCNERAIRNSCKTGSYRRECADLSANAELSAKVSQGSSNRSCSALASKRGHRKALKPDL